MSCAATLHQDHSCAGTSIHSLGKGSSICSTSWLAAKSCRCVPHWKGAVRLNLIALQAQYMCLIAIVHSEILCTRTSCKTLSFVGPLMLVLDERAKCSLAFESHQRRTLQRQLRLASLAFPCLQETALSRLLESLSAYNTSSSSRALLEGPSALPWSWTVHAG